MVYLLATARALDRARRAKRLSHAALAQMLGLSATHVGNIVSRGVPTSLRTIVNLAEIVGADIEPIRGELLEKLAALRAERSPLAREIETRLDLDRARGAQFSASMYSENHPSAGS